MLTAAGCGIEHRKRFGQDPLSAAMTLVQKATLGTEFGGCDCRLSKVPPTDRCILFAPEPS